MKKFKYLVLTILLASSLFLTTTVKAENELVENNGEEKGKTEIVNSFEVQKLTVEPSAIADNPSDGIATTPGEVDASKEA